MAISYTNWKSYAFLIDAVIDTVFTFVSAKLARLKQAKEEAEREVAEFRAQMEAEFQRKLTEVKSKCWRIIK